CALSRSTLVVARNLGFRTAHDSSDGDRPRGIRDNEDRRVQFPFNTVERLHFLVEAGTSNDDLMPGQRIRIECVKRLAKLQHYVIGSVRDIVDRPHSKRFKTRLDRKSTRLN